MLSSLVVACALLPLPQQPPLLKADFDTGADGFVYGDDLFRGTNQPNYAAGAHAKTGGFQGGGLQVTLGGRDNNTIFGMSGGWRRSFTVPNLGNREVFLSFRLKIDQTPDYLINAFSQALASVNGKLYGQRPFDYAALVIGDGFGGGKITSYWKLIRLRLGKLPKGNHTLVLGAYNNTKSSTTQTTDVFLDEVRVTVEDPVDTVAGAKAIVSLTSFTRFKENIRILASFGDRRQGSQSYTNADRWLQKQLEAVGYKVQRHQYTYANQARDEIYVTKVGTKYPDRMFLVSAHFDGRGNGGAADDDGSGCSLVLEGARAFATPGIETEISVRFLFWNNEETGLQGSTAYVNARRSLQGLESPARSGKYPEPTWLGMIQHDMILFDHGLPPQAKQIAAADMDVEYQSSAYLAQQALTLAQALAGGNKSHALKYPAQIGSNMRNTDSWPFRNVTAAVSMRENQRVAEIGRGSNPHWHRTTDVFSTYSDDDFRLGYDITRTTLGTVAELVGTFDRRASFQVFGQGCRGSAGIPTLTGEPPWLGEPFALSLGPLPTGAAVLLIGASNTRWGTLTLPLDLGAGCELFVSPDVMVPLLSTGGNGSWTVTLPQSPQLVGLQFFTQGLVHDPGLKPARLVVSNAGQARLGTR